MTEAGLWTKFVRFFREKDFKGRNPYRKLKDSDEDDESCCVQGESWRTAAGILWRRSVSCGNIRFQEDRIGEMLPVVPSMTVNLSAVPSALTEDCYEGVKNPYIVLINNVTFETMPAPRGGAVADVDNLLEFFRDSGFTSIVDYYDLRQDEMLERLENTSKNFALVENDAFICIVMTHGDAEGLKGVDDWRENSINVERITSMFTGDKCPYLITKPKLFFIQACRGDKTDRGFVVPRGSGDHDLVTDALEKEMVVKLPSEADILVAYSTTKYHVSYRKLTDNERAMVEHREEMGSWFISCMVQVFNAYSHAEDLMTMMAKVNRAMIHLHTGGDPALGNKQISCQLSMLTKRLYFAKYWEQTRRQLR